MPPLLLLLALCVLLWDVCGVALALECCKSYRVSGAGSLPVNGVYKRSLVLRDGVASYVNNHFTLLRFRFSTLGNRYWYISQLASVVANDKDYYRALNGDPLPPDRLGDDFPNKVGKSPSPLLECIEPCSDKEADVSHGSSSDYSSAMKDKLLLHEERPHQEYVIQPGYLMQTLTNLGFWVRNSSTSDNVFEFVTSNGGMVVSPSEHYRMEVLKTRLIIQRSFDISNSFSSRSPKSKTRKLLSSLLGSEEEGNDEGDDEAEEILRDGDTRAPPTTGASADSSQAKELEVLQMINTWNGSHRLTTLYLSNAKTQLVLVGSMQLASDYAVVAQMLQHLVEDFKDECATIETLLHTLQLLKSIRLSASATSFTFAGLKFI